MRIANVNLKKILVAVICLVLAITMVACNYKTATENGTPTTNGTTNGATDGDTSGGGESGDDTQDVFTVKLNTAIPYAYLSTVKAIWTDTESNNGAFYSANFDRNGVATVSGLDGDFRVTLSEPPEGYTYNPNIYFANNESRDVVISLYELKTFDNPNATGLDSLDPFIMKETGAYRIQLTERNFENGLWMRYIPSYKGNYSIESMIDVTANKINPILDYHHGNNQFVNSEGEQIIGGGESNTYTKNFRWEYEFLNVGNAFNFHVYATALDKGAFPVNIDFILERDGEFTGDDGRLNVEAVESTHDFTALESVAFSDKTTAFVVYGKYDGNNNVLDGSKVHYAGDEYTTEAEKKANDYYYVLDSAGNKKILYAQISIDNEVIETDSRSGFCDAMNAPRKIEGKDENNVKRYYNYVGFISTYNSHCEDGYYPVTKELQLFLQRFSTSRRLFNDGNGIGEYNNSGVLFLSSESNQWLFACGVFA